MFQWTIRDTIGLPNIVAKNVTRIQAMSEQTCHLRRAEQAAIHQWVVGQASRYLRMAEQATAHLAIMEQAVMPQGIFDRIIAATQILHSLKALQNPLGQSAEGARRWLADCKLVQTQLPKRGWYLHGKVGCRLFGKLARYIRRTEWEKVDEAVLAQLPEFDAEQLRQRLSLQSVATSCIDRLLLFFRHHKAANYEESTFLGVPLIDELAQHLYKGKSFTTKRGSKWAKDQSKPELAFRTLGAPDVGQFYLGFIEQFGSIHEDVDTERLADEDCWNRHAIVHGMMRRPMGIKDSAKCLMAIAFLMTARSEDMSGQPVESN